MESKYYIKFAKPYEFEGETTEGIDLGRLEELSTADLCNAVSRYNRLANPADPPEKDITFCLLVAQQASTDTPLEYLLGLPAREGVKVMRLVQRTFFD